MRESPIREFGHSQGWTFSHASERARTTKQILATFQTAHFAHCDIRDHRTSDRGAGGGNRTPSAFARPKEITSAIRRSHMGRSPPTRPPTEIAPRRSPPLPAARPCASGRGGRPLRARRRTSERTTDHRLDLLERRWRCRREHPTSNRGAPAIPHDRRPQVRRGARTCPAEGDLLARPGVPKARPTT